MSISQPTLEDIWLLFKESDRKMRELNEETSKKIRETNEETSKKIRESSEETGKKIRESSEETNKYIREVSKETDRKIKQITENLGRLTNKLGDFVEEMVRPAAVRLFKERGINVHEVHQNISSTRGNEGIEIDLLVVNDGDVIVIECKSSLSIDNVKEHLLRLEKVKRLLPAYADKRVMGAVTAMVLPDNVAQFAYRQGLFVIAQTGNHLWVRNDTQFQPKIW